MQLGIYKHYKGHEYRVLFLAKNSENLEDVVVYQDVETPDKIWVRPLSMFEEIVEIDGQTRPRFEFWRE